MSNGEIAKTNNECANVYSDEQKKRAAYALNLCLVSISQIIDYDDIYILEQEYEAILNNLNLEYMPKDEALLKILSLILDTVTFFRIQEGDKKIIEQEYRQKMKDAIWNAVPNLGVIVAGGNWATMAVSLVSQVGIGYMNYRRTKAGNNRENAQKQWKLQRSAIEQFNGLRRELFDTSWRLANEYNFADQFRLTERQIAQYNQIILDKDCFRRYERLEFIKDKFGAYPPFWYYLGNAAAQAYCVSKDEKQREWYMNKAKEHFGEYLNITEMPLLRNDEIKASCALEYIELLDPKTEMEEIERALKAAIDNSENKSDIIQLCAMSYIKIGNLEQAARLLRNLVNEDYNKNVNIQMLSRVYGVLYDKSKNDEYKVQYSILKEREPGVILYPWIESKSEDDYAEKQHDHLKNMFKEIIAAYKIQQETRFDEADPMTGKSAEELAYAENIEEQKMGNAPIKYIGILNDIVSDVGQISFLAEKKDVFANIIANNIMKCKSDLQKILNGNNREWTHEKHFPALTEYLFERIIKIGNEKIDSITMDKMNEINEAESDLYKFCETHQIDLSRNTDDFAEDAKKIYISVGLLGTEALNKSRETESMNKMINAICDGGIIKDISECSFIKRDSADFRSFIKALQGDKNYPLIKNMLSIVVLKKYKDDSALLFTHLGVAIVEKSKITGTKHIKCFVGYEMIKATIGNDDGLLKKIENISALPLCFDPEYIYENEYADMLNLYRVIEELGDISGKTWADDKLYKAEPSK